ncbi:ArsR/SmtB family transcription factor [Corynebacterium sp. H113]|uniref:ArsR/SmtB family transcription factor n=1 Tax=Corynebacterium sp. H113 TaxID=3133419 RepID=UPI00309D2074
MNTHDDETCSQSALIQDSAAVAPIVDILKALGDKTRLQLALYIDSSDEPVCACAFPEAFNMSQSTVSHHLGRLVDAGILNREKRGKWSFFSIAASFDAELLALIQRQI